MIAARPVRRGVHHHLSDPRRPSERTCHQHHVLPSRSAQVQILEQRREAPVQRGKVVPAEAIEIILGRVPEGLRVPLLVVVPVDPDQDAPGLNETVVSRRPWPNG